MTEQIFDHERRDVYRLAIDYVASSFRIAKSLIGPERHARDQWLRAAQSIPLNIAEAMVSKALKTKAVSSRLPEALHWNAQQSTIS